MSYTKRETPKYTPRTYDTEDFEDGYYILNKDLECQNGTFTAGTFVKAETEYDIVDNLDYISVFDGENTDEYIVDGSTDDPDELRKIFVKNDDIVRREKELAQARVRDARNGRILFGAGLCVAFISCCLASTLFAPLAFGIVLGVGLLTVGMVLFMAIPGENKILNKMYKDYAQYNYVPVNLKLDEFKNIDQTGENK